MDLSKSYEYFKPEKIGGRVHIIGCGSIGSTVAENLARCGVKKFTLWDFDTVESHNLANQMFLARHVGKPKVEALLDILCEINDEVRQQTRLKPKGWNGEQLSGAASSPSLSVRPTSWRFLISARASKTPSTLPPTGASPSSARICWIP